ncbi:MAG: amidohydrolase [Phycisphaerales bacterium]|nr:amidohydrolase [Phycisphaerales bacterium]
MNRREFLQGSAALGVALATTGCATTATRDRAAAKPIRNSLRLVNGRFITMNPAQPRAACVEIHAGRFAYVGDDRAASATQQTIDLGGRSVIPGLIDSHLHLIRGGLNYNMELRWDGITSLADAMNLLKRQVQRTPAPQWVRVVGGFCELQFKERRLPTLEELNAVAPDTPVFILHLYDRALLNRAALRALGYTKDTPNPSGGRIERDLRGNPTGLLVAKPNASILYKTLALGPKLSFDDQLNSTRHFMRELNRLGVTSCIDAGGGFQNFPDDYAVVEKLNRDGHMTVRIAYNLFTQRPKGELEDFSNWTKTVRPGQGDAYYRANGAGEMLVYSAADFEDFREPRPEMPRDMEDELSRVVRLLAGNRWAFRLHATYDQTIARALDVFEAVNRDIPLRGIPWFFDHAETVSDRNLERVSVLGGGIAIQHRMAFQGEYFVDQYGAAAAERTPPIRRMIEMGLPVGGGTDATRVASYNPWVSLFWLVTGKTLGGTLLYPAANRLTREEALRLWTTGSAWFSSEQGVKGAIVPDQLADLAVLSRDFFAVPEDEIKSIESELTIVGGQIVHAGPAFASLAPPPVPISPDWSPLRVAQSSLGCATDAFAGQIASAGCSCFMF